MKGIVLAGGSGTRLYPLTKVINKQLMPVYNKPAIYYPLSTFMLAGIRDILVISSPRDIPAIRSLLGDGSSLGLHIDYAIQDRPTGIADAFILGEEFIGSDSVSLILGDNFFYCHRFGATLEKIFANSDGATIFGYHVADPSAFGVVAFDNNGQVQSLEEKPQNPKSNWAVTGLYIYDNQVVELAKNLKPSPRGELEITDINKAYLARGKLSVRLLGRGVTWLDIGTADGLLTASQFVQTIEVRQGLQIGCPEEIAFSKGWISLHDLEDIIDRCPSKYFAEYLKSATIDRPQMHDQLGI